MPLFDGFFFFSRALAKLGKRYRPRMCRNVIFHDPPSETRAASGTNRSPERFENRVRVPRLKSRQFPRIIWNRSHSFQALICINHRDRYKPSRSVVSSSFDFIFACRGPRAACRVPRAACRVPHAACRMPRAANLFEGHIISSERFDFMTNALADSVVHLFYNKA